ncbi:hypothetical protein SERLA73DRAFT_101950 [Serpula lacrymans var. lacrymans S7.3]|uniref:Protein UNC80 C-terminal domain-containing protein n=1 Tax=Serpula lacrymans var. lacrymans (strain S7.3) TaxID=936435 RepID=F8PIR9_SERL3|nr:hypothetical protein SERLA73DRAFT_101950 [Serpula lacrymans var. lacrymans S7.3]
MNRRDDPSSEKIVAGNWTEEPLVQSPVVAPDEDVSYVLEKSTPPPKLVSSLRSDTKTSSSTPASEKSGAPPSRTPSRVRWDRLRQHVVPSATSRPDSPSSAASHTSSTQTLPPSRPQTPKPSRLARLGFRQVVEHAREAAIDDSRKFSDEVFRICWTARTDEAPSVAQSDREPTLGTMGSSLYLPFMSNSALSSATNMSTATLNQKNDIRRPQSLYSLAQISSTKSLHEAVLRYSSRNPSCLPHENIALSTLLVPFVSLDIGKSMEEDRWLAIEAFEVAVKAWKPASHEFAVQRCLWCCKAASNPSSVRNRIIGVLTSLLFPRDGSFKVNAPDDFRSLVRALFSLLAAMSVQHQNLSETAVIKELISQIRSGTCGVLATYLLEAEVDGKLPADFDEADVRNMFVAEALVQSINFGVESHRRWIFHNYLEVYWPQPRSSAPLNPLTESINVRKLITFSYAALALLPKKVIDASTMKDAELVVYILQTRVFIEVQCLTGKQAIEVRKQYVKVILDILRLADAPNLSGFAERIISQWYNEKSEWQDSFERTIQCCLANDDWPVILKLLSTLFKVLPDSVRRPLFTESMSSLHDRLVIDPPPYPCLPLSRILGDIAQVYPQLFFKPLFACAASTKELAIVNQLLILTALSRFSPDFWIRDPEMICVALISGVGGDGTGNGELSWGKVRLGQMVILTELIASVERSHQVHNGLLYPDSLTVTAVRFFSVLEARLGIILEAMEHTTLVPLSQRILLLVLFNQIRLFTRSLKRLGWYSIAITWLLQSDVGAEIQGLEDPIDEDALDEIVNSMNKLEALYITAQEGLRVSHQRRSTMVLPFKHDGSIFRSNIADGNTEIMTIFSARAQFIASLPRNVILPTLELLVTISMSLLVDDYKRIGPFLWTQCLHNVDQRVVHSTCSVFMQCIEKNASDFLSLIKSDLCSDHVTKLRSIQGMGTLINQRFQILSQNYIVDRKSRRPFKLARDPLPFIATDIGSSLYVREDDTDDSHSHLPPELRRRLSEVGWMEDSRPADQKWEWVMTPLSLLPSYRIDRMDGSVEQFSSSPTMSPLSTPTKPRSSSDASEHPSLGSSNHLGRTKRRAVFVPSLAAIFPQLASLVFDQHFAVASAARGVLLDMMRNDPILPTRPIFDLLGDGQLASAITTIRAFLHIRTLLPPALTHYAFNNLTGFLKFSARESETHEALYGFALSVPILSKLVTQVSDMSIRELRRAKVDMFLIPTGSLWFSASSPSGPMFPRDLQLSRNPYETPPSLLWITMIRLSQNMLFLTMLKRHPHDVQQVRKTMSRLVLPSKDCSTEVKPLELVDFIPHTLHSQRIGLSLDASLRGLSLMLSRSYLLLIAQIFRSMSRHLSDRNELAVLIDGLNRILLVHGDDIGIVSHSMIALMVASTRFRRLFTSGGGYPLFIPAVIKVYAEAESHIGIRQAIEYAANRFYALHHTTFLFQSLDTMAHIVASSNEGEWITQSIYTLLSTLQKDISSGAPDAAGIHNSNRMQEREALMVITAEEKPQTFLASLRPAENPRKDNIIINLPQEYETKRLRMDDFVRLFLTVIAHDPTILRAAHFLRLLRYLAPSFCQSQSAKPVLREGIEALGVILIRATAKLKPSDVLPAQSVADLDLGDLYQEAFLGGILHNMSKTPCDVASMRTDYLSLVNAFIRAGGKLTSATFQRLFELVKLTPRESANQSEQIASFLSDFSRLCLLRVDRPGSKETLSILQNLASVMAVYASSVGFAGVYEAIAQLSSDLVYTNDSSFCRLVVTEVCRAGLEAYLAKFREELPSLASASSSLVHLLSQAVSFHGADVLAEIERLPPSHSLLMGVVLPLVLKLKTAAVIVADGHHTDTWRRDTHANAWMRLLSYAMTACQAKIRSQKPSHSPERAKSLVKRHLRSSTERIMTIFASLQVIKAIIVRAEDDLSIALTGIWARVASFLKSLLVEGDARFAINRLDQSAPPSPLQSPRSSLGSIGNPFNIAPPDIRRRSELVLSQPRIVDYMLWSLLELVCLCRNPLQLQLRLLGQEKVALLDQELRLQFTSATIPRGRRLSSSIFSKPRRRISSIHSNVSSAPNTQPIHVLPPAPNADMWQAGFERFSTLSPGGTSPHHIVHLGPVRQNYLTDIRRSTESTQGIGRDIHQLTKSATVKSQSLVRATYQRIRRVQAYMGYDVLLPMQNGFEANQNVDEVRAWTKREAIEALLLETKWLSEEFEEMLKEAEDDTVIVDVDDPLRF